MGPFFMLASFGFVWQLSLPETAALRASKRYEAISALPLRLGLGSAGTKGGRGLCNEGAEETAGGRGCKTNPIPHKPAWKSYRNEAKNEPNFRSRSGSAGCGLWLGDNPFHLRWGLAGS